MKVALCCVGKLENRYAKEFINYYKNLGFDNIYIIDNNDIDGEDFDSFLYDEIISGFVKVLNCKGLKFESSQCMFYINVYNQYLYKHYDWIAFFDFDEFLVLPKDKDIKKFLSRSCFNNYNQILINWKIYTDNDLIYDDGRPNLERFTTPMEKYKNIEYKNIPENCICKPIIRGNIDKLNMLHPHNFNTKMLDSTTCNSIGQKVKNSFYIKKINWNNAYIKHFVTKTIDEFITNKYIKGVGDRDYETFKKTYPIERFFKYNNITKEKLEYLKEKNININLNKIHDWYLY